MIAYKKKFLRAACALLGTVILLQSTGAAVLAAEPGWAFLSASVQQGEGAPSAPGTEPSPAPTGEPTLPPQASPAPEASATPGVSPSPEASVAPEGSPDPSASPSPDPSVSPSPTPEPSITPLPEGEEEGEGRNATPFTAPGVAPRVTTDTNRLSDLFQAEPYTDREYLHQGGRALDGGNPTFDSATPLFAGQVGFRGVSDYYGNYHSIFAAPMSVLGNTITLTSPEYSYNPFYLRRDGATATGQTILTSELTRGGTVVNFGGREIPIDSNYNPQYGFRVELTQANLDSGFITQVGTVARNVGGVWQKWDYSAASPLQVGDYIFVDGNYANMQAGVLTSTVEINMRRSWELDQEMQLAAAPDGNALVLHNDDRSSDQVRGAQEGVYLGIYPSLNGVESGIKNGLALELDNSNNKASGQDIDPQFGSWGDYYNENVHVALHPTGRYDSSRKNVILTSNQTPTAVDHTYWAVGRIPKSLTGDTNAKNPAQMRVKMTWYAANDQSQPAWLWSYNSASAGNQSWSQAWEDGERAAGTLPQDFPADATDLLPSPFYHLVVEIYEPNDPLNLALGWKLTPVKVLRLALTEGEVVDMFTNDYRVGAGAANTATSWDWTARLTYACATNYANRVGGDHLDPLNNASVVDRQKLGATTTTFKSFQYMGFSPQAGVQITQVAGTDQVRPVNQGETVTFAYTVRNRRLTPSNNNVAVQSVLTLPEEFFQNFDRGSVKITSIVQQDPSQPAGTAGEEILAQVNALNGGNAAAALCTEDGMVFNLVGNPMTFTITAVAKDTLGQPWDPDSDPAVLALKIKEKETLLGDTGSVTVHTGVDTVNISVDPWDYLDTKKSITKIGKDGRTFDCTIRASLPEFLPDEVVQQAFGKVRADSYDVVLVIDNQTQASMQTSIAAAKEYLNALRAEIHANAGNPAVFAKITGTRVGIATYGGDVAVPLTVFHDPSEADCAARFIDALDDIAVGSYPSMLGGNVSNSDYLKQFSIPVNPQRYVSPVDASAYGGFGVGNHLLTMQLGADSPLETLNAAGRPIGLTYSTDNQGNYYYSKVLLFDDQGLAGSFQQPHTAPAALAKDMMAALTSIKLPMPPINDFAVDDRIDEHFYPTHEFSSEPSAFNESFVRWDHQNIKGGQTLKWMVQVRARASFLGGNMVPTNTPESHIYKEGKKDLLLPIPTANVRLLPLKSFCEEQYLFYGQTFDPIASLTQVMLPQHNKLNEYKLDETIGNMLYEYEGMVMPLSVVPEQSTYYYLNIDYQPYTLGDRMIALGVAKIVDGDKLVRIGNGRYLDPVGTELHAAARSESRNILALRVVKGQIDLKVENKQEDALPGNQSYLFRITRQAGNTREVFYEVIQGEGSKAINGLKWGTYTVEELGNWSWRYDNKGYLDVNPGYQGNNPDDATVVLGERASWTLPKITAPSQYTGAQGTDKAAKVTFTTGLQTKDWLSDTTYTVDAGAARQEG